MVVWGTIWGVLFSRSLQGFQQTRFPAPADDEAGARILAGLKGLGIKGVGFRD